MPTFKTCFTGTLRLAVLTDSVYNLTQKLLDIKVFEFALVGRERWRSKYDSRSEWFQQHAQEQQNLGQPSRSQTGETAL